MSILPPECHPAVNTTLDENAQAWGKTSESISGRRLAKLYVTFFHLISSWLKGFLETPSEGNLRLAPSAAHMKTGRVYDSMRFAQINLTNPTKWATVCI